VATPSPQTTQAPAQEVAKVVAPETKPVAAPVVASSAPVRAKKVVQRTAAAPARPTSDQPKPVVRITQVGAPALTPEVEEAPLENLPETPSRDDVLARLEALRSSVKACAGDRSGVADLDVTIAGTGIITNVQVTGDFAGTPEGSCIARTVRQARFPRFAKDRFRLLYPYSL
jgi:hypothetical protein